MPILVSLGAFESVAGAICTTLDDASEVDSDICDLRDDAYLNGEPGKGTGTIAAGRETKDEGPQAVGVHLTNGVRHTGTFTIFIDVCCRYA